MHLDKSVFDKICLKNDWSHYNEIHSTLNEMTLQFRKGISEASHCSFVFYIKAVFFGHKIYEKLENFRNPFYS